MEKFRFREGVYFNGSDLYEISNKKIVHTHSFQGVFKTKYEYDIPVDFDESIMKIIKNWGKTYHKNMVLDGHSWSLEIENKGEKIEISGSNDYPSNYGVFDKYIRKITNQSGEGEYLKEFVREE